MLIFVSNDLSKPNPTVDAIFRAVFPRLLGEGIDGSSI